MAYKIPLNKITIGILVLLFIVSGVSFNRFSESEGLLESFSLLPMMFSLFFLFLIVAQNPSKLDKYILAVLSLYKLKPVPRDKNRRIAHSKKWFSILAIISAVLFSVLLGYTLIFNFLF